jgi:hypothetical protein
MDKRREAQTKPSPKEVRQKETRTERHIWRAILARLTGRK